MAYEYEENMNIEIEVEDTECRKPEKFPESHCTCCGEWTEHECDFCYSEKLKTLLIDDIRNIDGVDVVVRNYDSAKMLLEEIDWKEIYIDHDLGEKDDKKNGYTLISDALEHTFKLLRYTQKITIVSSNPVGINNIGRVLQRHGWIPNANKLVWRNKN